MKIHFAWGVPSEEFKTATHCREDEKIFHLEIGQNEGAFARARVTIQNPKHGLLWPQNKQHCLISLADKLMFRGRLISMPTQFEGELVTLEFIGMGGDCDEQRRALCSDIKENGVYDRLFFSAEPELRDLLQAYTSLPHWDRKTNILSLSNISKGRKSLNLAENFIRDSLRVIILQEPLTAVNVELQAEWLQQAKGSCEITHHLKKACAQGYLSSLTGDSLEQAWWRSVKQNGYKVQESRLKPITPLDKKAFPSASNELWHWDEKPKLVQFPRRWYDMCLRLGWSYRQKRRESAAFTLHHHVQKLAGSTRKVKNLRFSLASILGQNHPWWPNHNYTRGFQVLYEDEVYKCIRRHQSSERFNPSKWIKQENHIHVNGQAARATFFTTERGQHAIAYALEVAKAYLAASARCINIELTCPLEHLIEVSLDHNLTIEDSRLPGGAAQGKVIGYRFIIDGKTGERLAHVKLGVSIGSGISVTKEFQEDEGYAQSDTWEEHVSTLDDIYHRSPSSICFRIPGDQPVPLGIHRPVLLSAHDLIEEVEIVNDGEEQNRKLTQKQYPHSLDLKTVLKEMPTDVRLKLKDLRTYGCLDHKVQVDVLTTWAAPKQLDLSAPPKD